MDKLNYTCFPDKGNIIKKVLKPKTMEKDEVAEEHEELTKLLTLPRRVSLQENKPLEKKQVTQLESRCDYDGPSKPKTRPTMSTGHSVTCDFDWDDLVEEHEMDQEFMDSIQNEDHDEESFSDMEA